MSSGEIIGLVAGVLAVLLGGLLAAPRLLRWQEERELRRALAAFKLQRENLEAKFFELASTLGKPRDLRWTDCDWQSAVTFAREVNTRLLTAFVAVEIRFEAVVGGDMEDVEAVSTIRDASAVFHYRGGRWGTGGKALFNMNPHDALERLAGQFVPVGRAAQSR